jgi:(S)-2-hydroxyglutarate dehydrogenase
MRRRSATGINLFDLADTFAYSGFWRFLGNHRRMCWDEACRSFRKRLFWESLQRLVPEIRESDLETGGVGVRAQAIERTGSLVQDFRFVARPNALHVLNAPSPAAAASLAIGDAIVEEMERAAG